MKRGQISTEFIIILSIFLIILLTVALIANRNSGTAREKRVSEDAQLIADTLSIHISNVYFGGHGTFVQITLPQKIGTDTVYSTTISPSERRLDIKYAKGSSSASLPTKNIKGDLNFPSGNLNITNQRGVIVIVQ